MTPYVKVEPPIAGPSARPTAPTLVAIPLRVPRIRKLLAEFVRRMVEQGKAKVETASTLEPFLEKGNQRNIQKPLMIIMIKIATC